MVKNIKNTHYHFFDNKQTTIVFNTFSETKNNNIQYVKITNPTNYIEEMFRYLYDIKCQSIIIEGGRRTLDTFIQKNLWDEARVLIGNKIFNKGLLAPKITCSFHTIALIEDNKVLYLQNEKM